MGSDQSREKVKKPFECSSIGIYNVSSGPAARRPLKKNVAADLAGQLSDCLRADSGAVDGIKSSFWF